MMHVQTGPKSPNNKAQNVIIALTDEKQKSFREYNFQKDDLTRRCEVHMPFDTEYQILVKNNNYKRIKLDIDIDGTNVTESGLIVPSLHNVFLERFVGVDRKFKFVPADHEAVVDPSSKDNGIIRVKVTTEKSPPQVLQEDYSKYTFPKQPWQPNPWQPTWTSSSLTDSPYSCLRGGMSTKSLHSGATVEGGHSDQTFGSTTWEGDEDTYTFIFKVLGIESEVSESDKAALEKYKKLQEELKKKGLI